MFTTTTLSSGPERRPPSPLLLLVLPLPAPGPEAAQIPPGALRLDDAGRLLNERLEPYAVVHQYDRHPDLAEHFLRANLGLDPGHIDPGGAGGSNLIGAI
eukprot:tig00000157_g9637.t1